MKPTKVQREVLALLAETDTDIEYPCYDCPNAICVGDHWHLRAQTFYALNLHGWIEQCPLPSESRWWVITDAGREVIR